MTTLIHDPATEFKGLDTTSILRPKHLNCPACQRAGQVSALEPKSAEDVDFFHCRHCGGVWFHDKQVDEALKAVGALQLPDPLQVPASAPTAPEADWLCPCCKGTLVAVLDCHGRGVKVQRCLVCYGGWLGYSDVRKAANSSADLLSRIGRMVRKLVS